MAETDRWPTKEAPLEVFERESAAAAAARSENDLDPAGRRVAGAIDEDPGADLPALMARLRGTETGVSADDAKTVPAGGATAGRSIAAARVSATNTSQRRVANFVASEYARRLPDWRRLGRRWVVPVLALVVMIQSAWLIKDRFRNDVHGTANPSTSIADDRSDQTTRATSGVQAAATQRADGRVTSQAALADKRIASNNSATAKRGAPAAVPAATPVARPGSVLIAVPFQVEVYENGRFVGINGENGVPLAPGSHRLELVNESLRYRSSHTVAVTSGRTTPMKVALPTGMLHLNAAPWAEVLIDGNSVGETPLANIEVPIGSHRVTFRHPQWGEQTRNIVVAADSTTRIGVDLQK